MKFEYNGNLLEKGRVEQVAQEILALYPEIPLEQAKKMAMLEGAISTDYNIDMAFVRYYNIMLIMKKDPSFVKRVFQDLISILEKQEKEKRMDYYKAILLEIGNYLMGIREFPYLKEF